MGGNRGGVPFQGGTMGGAQCGGLSTAHIRRKVTGTSTFWVGGSLLTVSKPKISNSQLGGGPRGKVCIFSKNSRRRLMRSLAKTMKKDFPIFITLTYPEEFPGSPEEWKRHLKNFLSRMSYKFPGCSGFWKLEPQKRGAPHYHLLIWGADFLKLFCWVPEAWYKVVKSGDEKHLRAGTSVQRVRTWRGVMSYASKYLGKNIDKMPGWEHVGRYWGIFSRKQVPWAKTEFAELNYKQATKMLRLLRRYAHLKGRDYKSLTIFCNDPAYWLENIQALC